METNREPTAKFGRRNDQGRIALYEFIRDPDGSNLPWFARTGEQIGLEGLKAISAAANSHSGRCYDTMEYWSHLGVMLQELVTEAPEGTSLAVFDISAAVGTRTFSERVEVDYYGPEGQPE